MTNCQAGESWKTKRANSGPIFLCLFSVFFFVFFVSSSASAIRERKTVGQYSPFGHLYYSLFIGFAACFRKHLSERNSPTGSWRAEQQQKLRNSNSTLAQSSSSASAKQSQLLINNNNGSDDISALLSPLASGLVSKRERAGEICGTF